MSNSKSHSVIPGTVYHVLKSLQTNLKYSPTTARKTRAGGFLPPHYVLEQGVLVPL